MAGQYAQLTPEGQRALENAAKAQKTEAITNALFSLANPVGGAIMAIANFFGGSDETEELVRLDEVKINAGLFATKVESALAEQGIPTPATPGEHSITFRPNVTGKGPTGEPREPKHVETNLSSELMIAGGAPDLRHIPQEFLRELGGHTFDPAASYEAFLRAQGAAKRAGIEVPTVRDFQLGNLQGSKSWLDYVALATTVYGGVKGLGDLAAPVQSIETAPPLSQVLRTDPIMAAAGPALTTPEVIVQASRAGVTPAISAGAGFLAGAGNLASLLLMPTPTASDDVLFSREELERLNQRPQEPRSTQTPAPAIPEIVVTAAPYPSPLPLAGPALALAGMLPSLSAPSIRFPGLPGLPELRPERPGYQYQEEPMPPPDPLPSASRSMFPPDPLLTDVIGRRPLPSANQSRFAPNLKYQAAQCSWVRRCPRSDAKSKERNRRRRERICFKDQAALDDYLASL